MQQPIGIVAVCAFVLSACGGDASQGKRDAGDTSEPDRDATAFDASAADGAADAGVDGPGPSVLDASATDGGNPAQDGGVQGMDAGVMPGDASLDASVGDGGAADSGAVVSDASPDTGTPAPLPCTSDAECDVVGLICDPIAERCVKCLVTQDCDDGLYCSRRRCRPDIFCFQDGHCDAHADTPVCDYRQRRCVGCLEATDCGSGRACEGGECVEVEACTHTLDCGGGRVCDVTAGACVECVQDADCAAGGVCRSATCRTACGTDPDCAAEGLVCNAGACSPCASHADCPASFHCAEGSCLVDVCEAGSTFCGVDPSPGGYLYGTLQCDADGAGAEFVGACSAESTCRRTGAEAVCAPWVCDPFMRDCADEVTAIECSPDGLSVTDTEVCAPGLGCFEGECLLCAPSAWFCSDDARTRLRCSPSGNSATEMADCHAAGQYCEETALSICSPYRCPPSGVGCQANWRAECNALGSGFTVPLEDCGQQGLVCHQGACGPDAVDELANFDPGLTPIVYVGEAVGNHINVTLSRTLTEIRMRFRTSAQLMLAWVVYEIDGVTVTRVLHQQVNDQPVEADYYSSGQVSVTLAAGKTYFIGVVTDFDYVTEASIEAVVPQAITFGEATGSSRPLSAAAPPVTPMITNFLFSQVLYTSPGP